MAERPSFDNYFARNLDAARTLNEFTVLIVGVGATGSHCAACLAKSGVNLTLVDHDRLSVENLTRIYADARYLAAPKVTAVGATLKTQLPVEVRINEVEGDVMDADDLTEDELGELILSAAFVIDATADPEVTLQLNEWCARVGRPLLVPRLLLDPQGPVGDLMIMPWAAAETFAAHVGCFECVDPYGARSVAVDAAPGLVTAVVEVAAATSEFILGWLAGGHGWAWWSDQIERQHNYFLLGRGSQRNGIRVAQRRGCASCNAHASVSGRPPDSATDPRRSLRERFIDFLAEMVIAFEDAHHA